MKKRKIVPDLFLREDLLTKEDLEDITDRVLNKNEFLGDVVCDYDCHIYSLNRYILANVEIRKQFDEFINNTRNLLANKNKKDLTGKEYKKILIANEIIEINEKSKDANKAIELLSENISSREVAKQLNMSKTKMYDTLKAMGFEKNKTLKQWLHIDNKDLPINIEGLKRDIELIDLYENRYGDFDLYHSDYCIYMLDAEIMDDIRVLAEELNYETPNDLVSVFLLRGLQSLDYRNIKKEFKEKNKDNLYNISDNEFLTFLLNGEEGVKQYYEQALINCGYDKEKDLRGLKYSKLKDLYYKCKDKQKKY